MKTKYSDFRSGILRDSASTVFKVGDVVEKISGRPFKSSLKRNTVSGFSKHPMTGNDCFTFIEDDSTVECFRCKKADLGY